MLVESSPFRAVIANPFIAGRPLSNVSSSLFMGREDLFRWFEENLVGASRPNALLLYGQRRIGKTSALYQLVEGERGRALRENNEAHLYMAYIDLQRLAGRPTAEWLRRLARDICHRVGTSNLDRSVPDSPEPGETAYAAFDRCLDRLEQTLPEDGLILLAVDEFEQVREGIDNGRLEPELLPFLRSQIQHRSRIAFLLCGSNALLDPYWSAITDLTARWELDGLDYHQTVALIRRPLEGVLQVDDQAVDMIWQLTGGHPFQIQTICHRLVSLANRRHTHDTIQLVDVVHVVEKLAGERSPGQPGVSTTNCHPLPVEGTQP